MVPGDANYQLVAAIVSKVIPLLFLAAFGYASYTVVVPGSIHLLHLDSRAVATIVIYVLLLAYTLMFWVRLFITHFTDNGSSDKNWRGLKSGKAYPTSATSPTSISHLVGELALKARRPEPSYRYLRELARRDFYLCTENGYPDYCEKCANWKQDRAHHCRELDRCVRRMDHFCPWIGGIVGETTQKHFIQVLASSSLYTLYTLAINIYFAVEYSHLGVGVSPWFLVAIGLCGIFGVFATVMFGVAMELLYYNQTTVEWIDSDHRVQTFATILPQGFETSTLPAHVGSIHWPLKPSRTFAILCTKPGENIFDLGWKSNMKLVLGATWWEWLTPTRSRLEMHGDSWYPINYAVLNRLRRKAGLKELSENGENGDYCLEKRVLALGKKGEKEMEMV